MFQQLSLRFSALTLRSGRAIALVIAGGLMPFLDAGEPVEKPFTPDWESLKGYEVPDWFRDGKLGIYAHWGVYSAAQGSGNTDWLGRNMYKPGHPNYEEHLARYGSVKEFGYKDFIPQFTAENFDADEWADLFVEAGARFGGPVGEHADGFSMWDSAVNPWNAAKMGPKRDIVAEMEKAVRKRGLKFLVSLHHQWLWGWYPTWDDNTDAADPRYRSFYGPKYPPTAQAMKLPAGQDGNMASYPLPSREWQATWLAKTKEVVDRYSPDVLWFDNRMQILSESVRQEMAAHFLNHAHARGLEPVLNYKRPDMVFGTGTIDLERSRMPDIFPEPWLTDTSVSRSSWAYATDLEYYSADRLIDDLVDIVSKNGCMLLNIAPAPDGSIPETQQEILRGIGAWLEINGEAIYGSRPWLIFGEGPNNPSAGHLADINFDGFDERDIRFTTNNGFLFATVLGWPEGRGEIVITSLGSAKYAEEFSTIEMLGHDGALTWKRTPQGLVVDLPVAPPNPSAFTLKLTRERMF
ncbi:MAG: alpha-L-fucosidase [Synoicihabitans sp.]